MVKLRNVIIVLLLSFIGLNAQNISIKATTDSTNYFVGDYINYKLRIVKDKDISVNLSSVKDSVKGLEFIKEKPVKIIDENENQIVEEHIFVFSKYDSSEVLVPSYTLECLSEKNKKTFKVEVNDVFVSISTIDVDENKEIKDVKSPLRDSYNWIIIIVLLLLLIILVVVSYYYFKKRKSKNVEEKKIIKVAIPPYKIALKELHDLEEKKFWQSGKVKEYHTEITNIIRRYIEDEFRIPALERTSGELINEINKYEMFKEIKKELENFLNNADMVKFAKFKPNPSINELMMKEAYAIVHKTHKEPSEGEVKDV